MTHAHVPSMSPADYLAQVRPRFAPVDDDTADLLTLVADVGRVVGSDAEDAFLDACRRDAMAHGGLVSVNRVRALMADMDVEHHRYSAFWSRFTGRGRPMRKATTDDTPEPWEICEGSGSGNDGRPYKLRVWVGDVA